MSNYHDLKLNSNIPLVSICIPVFNSEKWLAETLSSAVNQTYKNIEIIVVDDGSTDKSWEIIESYRLKYPNIIKTHKQVNKGACAARNKALFESKGDYIQWLDADDILAKNKIEIQIAYILNNPDPFILHSSHYGLFYHQPKNAKFFSNYLFNDLTPDKWLYYHLKYGHYMFPAVWLVSRELTDLSGKWNEDLTNNDDGEYFARIISKSKLIKFHKDSVCFYRKGSYESISRSLSKNQQSLISLNKSINLTCDYLLNIDNSLSSKEACIHALSYICHLLKNDLPELYQSNLDRINSLGGVLIPKFKSKKYKFFEKIFGESIASKIKSKLWNLEVLYHEKLDLFRSKLQGDKINY